ncbi:uncharacterized protein C11orf24 homolog isoform 1-T3 [Thomomys bottae]
MWTALMLLCLSSLSLSAVQVASSEPLPNRTWSALINRNASVDATPRVETSVETTTVTPLPVTVSSQTLPATLNLTHSPTGTANRINTSIPTTTGSMAGSVASSTPGPTSLSPTSSHPTSSRPMSPSPMSYSPVTPRQAPSTTATRLSPLSTHHAQVPSTNASVPTTPSTRAATPHTSGAPSTLGPAVPTSAHSTASPAAPTDPQAQSSTIPVVTHQPVLTAAGRTPPRPLDATSEPTTPIPSVGPVTSVVTTTQAQAREPTASTAPAHHTSPALTAEARSPTTQPRPTPSNSGPGGPGAPQTPGQGETTAMPGTGPTPLNSGDQRMPATDSCQPSTPVPYLVVTPKLLAPSLLNRVSLLVVLFLGVALFATAVVMFALHAYESYKKKDYTQVDYLINGMYADSEM